VWLTLADWGGINQILVVSQPQTWGYQQIPRNPCEALSWPPIRWFCWDRFPPLVSHALQFLDLDSVQYVTLKHSIKRCSLVDNNYNLHFLMFMLPEWLVTRPLKLTWNLMPLSLSPIHFYNH
jgi:hypothetical protein